MFLDDNKLRRLLDVGRSLVTELDPETVLQRILDEARTATSARYAALGVLNDQRTGLGRFLTVGLDADAHKAIGDLPRGRGVLGVLIEHPEPLRLDDVGTHPQSYGFPARHPTMESFLGVPIMIRGQAWGNLYLAEKEGGGQFTDGDQEAAVILADWAATAIENARLYQSAEQRRVELERAVQGLEAARDIADAIGGAAELQRVLELVVKRGRALVNARSVLILLREGDELVVAASAGHVDQAIGRRLPIAGSTSGRVLERGKPERIGDVASTLRIAPEELGVQDAETALLVPMLYHGVGVGVLAAFDRGRDGKPFTAGDEKLIQTFAASAANAVAISRSVEADRLRSAIGAADAERSRWARELHDETLQALGALRVMLSSALRRDSAEASTAAMRQAVEDIDSEIDNLRSIISDLRPSLLDDIGLVSALEALLDRRREHGLEIASELAVLNGAGLAPEIETAVYRVVQEAMTNIVKHANASSVSVSMGFAEDELVIEVHDNGAGFDADVPASGFGLAGMRERVFLTGGTLELTSGDDGTLVRAKIPRAGAAAPRSVSARQLA